MKPHKTRKRKQEWKRKFDSLEALGKYLRRQELPEGKKKKGEKMKGVEALEIAVSEGLEKYPMDIEKRKEYIERTMKELKEE